jgi:hypothetical protein
MSMSTHTQERLQRVVHSELLHKQGALSHTLTHSLTHTHTHTHTHNQNIKSLRNIINLDYI